MVQAWYDGSLCGLPVMQSVIRRPVVRKARYGRGATRGTSFQIKARCASRGSMLGVVPDQGPLCRRDPRCAWYRPNARCAGVVLGGCGRRMLVATQKTCRAAEQCVRAEAAPRPRDRPFFEGQNRLERDPDLAVAAPLNATVRHPWQRDWLSFFVLDVANRASQSLVVPAPVCRSSWCRCGS